MARLIYLIGASGSGKDTILSKTKELLNSDDFVFVKRYITRPYSVSSKNGVDEDHYYLSHEDFEKKLESNFFAMHWNSHNNYYGIAKSINNDLTNNKTVIINGSREYLAQAKKDYPDLQAVLINVEPEVLKERLLNRGRETGADFIERLNGANKEISEDCIIIDNSGELDIAVKAFCEILG